MLVRPWRICGMVCFLQVSANPAKEATNMLTDSMVNDGNVYSPLQLPERVCLACSKVGDAHMLSATLLGETV